MRAAFLFTSTFGAPLTEGGRVPGGDSGRTLLRRLMSYYEHPILITDDTHPPVAPRGFDLMRLDQLPVNETVVISMDMLQSVPAAIALHRTWRDHPTVVNFCWQHLSDYPTTHERAMIATAAAQLPTFCNSPRTARQVFDCVRQFQSAAADPMLAECFLGIDVDSIPAHVETGLNTVRYPAIFANTRKGWDQWEEITQLAAAAESFDPAVRLMKPLPGTFPLLEHKDLYYSELARTHAFVATSLDESYGLQPLELLAAGAIGIFRDRPWVHEILPDDYPLIYSTKESAVALLLMALRVPNLVRDEVGDITGWVRKNHDSRTFRDKFTSELERWTGLAPIPDPGAAR